MFKLFRIKIKIEGEENIPKGRKGFVIVANHQSFLDINVMWPAIGNAAFMAKASLWKAPVFGWVISSIGCIPVHKNPRTRFFAFFWAHTIWSRALPLRTVRA